jgi:hypothetical protein
MAGKLSIFVIILRPEPKERYRQPRLTIQRAVAFAVTALVIFHPTYMFPVMSKGSKRVSPHSVEEKQRQDSAAGSDAASPAAIA